MRGVVGVPGELSPSPWFWYGAWGWCSMEVTVIVIGGGAFLATLTGLISMTLLSGDSERSLKRIGCDSIILS